MRRPERIYPRIVDQNIDMAVAQFNRSSRHLACAGCVAKVGGNELRFAPAERISTTAFWPRSALRPTSTTWIPSWASLRAVARPIPLVPPVISAVEVSLVIVNSATQSIG